MFDFLDGPADDGPSATVLDVDLWTMRRGERLARLWKGETALNPIRKELPAVAADCIDMLLATEPQLHDNPKDMDRAMWWADMLDAPELATLRTKTMHKPDIAGAAAIEIATAYAKRKQQQEQQGKGKGNGKDGKKGGEGEGQDDGQGQALRAAMEMADHADAAKKALGLSAGLGPGQETQVDPSMLVKYARQMRQNDMVRRVVEMAGRFIAKASRLRAARAEIPGVELAGIELSGDVARLVPNESAMVAGVVPELEMLAMLRLAQRRAMSYKRNAHGEARGPIVVSIDESGSMQGPRIIAAKALGLAMATIARQDKRGFALVGWSSGVSPRWFRSTKDAQADAPKLMHWITAFQGGGTELRYPLQDIPANWPKRPMREGRDDHIIITDDTGEAYKALVDGYKVWQKTTGVRTFGFVVGMPEPKGMLEYCDGGAWAVPSLTLDSDGLDTVLTI